MTSIHLRRLESRLARTGARLIEQATRDGVALAQLPALRLAWYSIRSQSDGDGDGSDVPTVLIFDEIGGSVGIRAKTFVQELEAIDAPVIHVRINSPGGSVFDAIAIANALRHHPAKILVYVDSLAVSAASVIAMGGDEVAMMPGSQMMIHDASALEDGNAADMRSMATFLDRQSDNVAELYRLRAGGELADWRELMLAETWMFAEEAVAFGLADRVEVARKPGPADERMARVFDLSLYQYRYADRRAAPAPRGASTTVTQRQVRTEGDRMATLVRPRIASAEEREAAAQRRAGGAERAGYQVRSARRSSVAFTAPEGSARLLRFPAVIAAKKVTYNDQLMVHLHGIASVTEQPYEMWDEFGPFDEIIDRHAFDITLAASPDVSFLANHRGTTMARTIPMPGRQPTLKLAMVDEDDTVVESGSPARAINRGLGTDAWVNPKRNDVNDLVIAVDDGDVTQMSFAFMLVEGWWSDDFTTFRITQVDLDGGDVSGVNRGANPYTSIAARQREILDDVRAMPAGAAKAALRELMRRTDVNIEQLYRAYAEGTRRDDAAALAGASKPMSASQRTPKGRSVSLIEALLMEED